MDNFIDTLAWITNFVFTALIIMSFLLIILSARHMHASNLWYKFILKVTYPFLFIFRKIIPVYKSIDFAAIVFLLVIELVYQYIVGFLQSGTWIDLSAVLLGGAGDLAHTLVAIFFWAIIIRVLMSWVAASVHQYVALQELLHEVTTPILEPFQRFVPPIAGIDFSPILALLLLKLIDLYLVMPLIGWGVTLSFSGA